MLTIKINIGKFISESLNFDAAIIEIQNSDLLLTTFAKIPVLFDQHLDLLEYLVNKTNVFNCSTDHESVLDDIVEDTSNTNMLYINNIIITRRQLIKMIDYIYEG
jgi:hypothetical protein